MKLESILIESMQLNSFIWHCVCGNGRMIVLGKNGNKAVVDCGKYIVRKDGKYVTQKNYSQLAICEIMKRLIKKYERFEYDGFLYHSPERNIWIKEEI